MPTWIVAIVGGFFAVLYVFSVARALRTGVASSFVRKYRVDEQPVGCSLCVLSDMGVVALVAAAVLWAFGIIGNPFEAIDAALPPFLRCPKYYYCGP
jgi:hypothetical protein